MCVCVCVSVYLDICIHSGWVILLCCRHKNIHSKTLNYNSELSNNKWCFRNIITQKVSFSFVVVVVVG